LGKHGKSSGLRFHWFFDAKIVGMADIDESTKPEPELITFSAKSEAAQEWMSRDYGVYEIRFNLPKDDVRVLEFRRAAEERGFSVRSL
jgi:hypothetical protein